MKCCLCIFLVPEKPERYYDGDRLIRLGYESVPFDAEYFPRESPYCRNLSADDGGEVVDPNVERTCKWGKPKESK